jgi:hypothetical protein
MAVHVDLCARGHACFDVRCGYGARLALTADEEIGHHTYCLHCALDRLGVRKTRGEQIFWTPSAKSWVESQGERVVA